MFEQFLLCMYFILFILWQSEEDEFEHFQDEEEFENFDKEKGSSSKVKGAEKLPDLQMAKVWFAKLVLFAVTFSN